MLTRSSHTHLQAAQASTQPKLTNKYACPNPRTDNKALVVTAPKKNGGGSANTNIVQLIKFGGYRQFSVPKPPLLLAANRYSQC